MTTLKEYLADKFQNILILYDNCLHVYRINLQCVREMGNNSKIPLKTYIKHMAIGSLISSLVTAGSVETYH
jgi:hypothetical protein